MMNRPDSASCANLCRRCGSAAWIAGILGSFLVVVALVCAMRSATRVEPVGAERVLERKKSLAELREAEGKALSGYDWQDKTKDIVRLPLDRAIALTVKEWADPKAARAGLIARVEKATAVPPPKPAAPNVYE